jgi:uncharacterized membrane protein YkvA (DUF1232 family)
MTSNVTKRRRRGASIIPFFGDIVVLTRLLRDGNAHWALKTLALATLIYVISPFDAIPDAFPIITWIDDVGLVLVMRLILDRQLTKYRYPLFEKPLFPKRRDDRREQAA